MTPIDLTSTKKDIFLNIAYDLYDYYTSKLHDDCKDLYDVFEYKYNTQGNNSLEVYMESRSMDTYILQELDELYQASPGDTELEVAIEYIFIAEICYWYLAKATTEEVLNEIVDTISDEDADFDIDKKYKIAEDRLKDMLFKNKEEEE